MLFFYNIFLFMILLLLILLNIPFNKNFNLLYFFLNSFNLKLNFNMMNFYFFFSLLIIYFSVLIFSFYYQEISFDFIRFSFLVFLFVNSMIFLIFHNNLFTLILGWDGLGVTSYLLVAYYNNWSSLNGAMVTMLTNRFGDFCLFWFMIFFLFFSFESMMINMSIITLIFLISSFTKSAQIPFSSWLPLAMSAPTPVSALVHSSTLVTAGIFICLKYFNILFNYFNFLILNIFGLTTMFIASLTGIFEIDGKKIIALSTLSQLGFMMFSLGCMLPLYCFFHLLSHAFFKSCLFIQMGNFIHTNFSNQDMRSFFSNFLISKLSSMIMIICLLSLSGFLFLSGFFSKEFIILMNFNSSLSFFFNLMLLLSISFTMIYSFRLFSIILSGNNNMFLNKMKNLKGLLSGCILICLSILFSWMFIFNFIYLPIEFLFFEKISPLIIFFISFLLYNMNKLYSKITFFNSLLFQDKLIKIFNYSNNKKLIYKDYFVNFLTLKLIFNIFYYFSMLKNNKFFWIFFNFMIILRSSFPRIRYDMLMKICWIFILPSSSLFLLIFLIFK